MPTDMRRSTSPKRCHLAVGRRGYFSSKLHEVASQGGGFGPGCWRQDTPAILFSPRMIYFCTRQAFIPSQRDRRVRFLATSSYVIISNSKSGGSAYSSTT